MKELIIQFQKYRNFATKYLELCKDSIEEATKTRLISFLKESPVIEKLFSSKQDFSKEEILSLLMLQNDCLKMQQIANELLQIVIAASKMDLTPIELIEVPKEPIEFIQREDSIQEETSLQELSEVESIILQTIESIDKATQTELIKDDNQESSFILL